LPAKENRTAIQFWKLSLHVKYCQLAPGFSASML
jgi:hypothetical protein